MVFFIFGVFGLYFGSFHFSNEKNIVCYFQDPKLFEKIKSRQPLQSSQRPSSHHIDNTMEHRERIESPTTPDFLLPRPCNSPAPEIRQVVLQKTNAGFGIGLAPAWEGGVGTVVQAINSDVLCKSEGEIAAGDQILSVNGINVHHGLHTDTISQFAHCNGAVTLLVSRA